MSAYNSHVSNAIHFACVKDDAGWIVEPLGWALLVARGGDAEKETVGDPHDDAEMGVHVSLGWRRVDEGDAGFDDLWRALHAGLDRLCPNCHAIVHRGEEVLDIEALRVLLGRRAPECRIP